jgi:hypothetical protein
MKSSAFHGALLRQLSIFSLVATKSSRAVDGVRGGVDAYDSGCPQVFGAFDNPCVFPSGFRVCWHVSEVSGHNKVVKRVGSLSHVKRVLADDGTHRKQILLDNAFPRLARTGLVGGQQQLRRKQS